MKTGTKADQLGTMNIGPLLTRMAVPAAIAMLAQSTYSLVDSIFVGNGVGPTALGALGVVMPFQLAVFGVAQLLAIGAGAIVSQKLGAGDLPAAQRTAGSTLGIALVLGIGVMFLVRVATGPILSILGASGELRAPARDYFRILAFAEPIILLIGVSAALLRSEGRARSAMIVAVLGTGLNIVLDPVFIFVLGWGIRGAAWATVIARAVSMVLGLTLVLGGRSALDLSLRHFRLDLKVVARVASIGVSGFLRMIGGSLILATANNLLARFGGEVYVSAFTATLRLMLFLKLPTFGITQGFLPIAGYNYGSGRHDRVLAATRATVISTTILACIALLIMRVFPDFLLRLFSSDPQLLSTGREVIAICSWGVIGSCLFGVGSTFYQATGKAGRALAINLSPFVIAVVMMLVLGSLYETPGVLIGYPGGHTGAGILSMLLLALGVSKLKKQLS